MHSKEALSILEKLFDSCEDARERRDLLQDLLTDAEQIDIAERWEIVRRLLDGLPQRTIQSEVGVSISLVTRASGALKSGGKGFRRVHGRLSSTRREK